MSHTNWDLEGDFGPDPTPSAEDIAPSSKGALKAPNSAEGAPTGPFSLDAVRKHRDALRAQFAAAEPAASPAERILNDLVASDVATDRILREAMYAAWGRLAQVLVEDSFDAAEGARAFSEALKHVEAARTRMSSRIRANSQAAITIGAQVRILRTQGGKR